MARTEAWFDNLYRQHHRQVLAYCLRRTRREDADDAAAEVFAVAWRRRHDLPDRDEALPWLYGVARNVLFHQWRSASRFRRLRQRLGQFPHPPTPGPETVVVEDQEVVHVRQALRQLRPGDQEALRLAAWEGLPHREIAGILGCSVVAVDKRLQRAKQRLKDQYESIRRTQDRPPATATGGGGGYDYD
jgi:RNA polymerase sigma-70 factor (ECF subfamily)